MHYDHIMVMLSITPERTVVTADIYYIYMFTFFDLFITRFNIDIKVVYGDYRL